MAEKCACPDSVGAVAEIEVKCNGCSSVVEKFSIKKPLKTVLIAGLLAYLGGNFIEYAVTDNRYPMRVEYDIISACVNSSHASMYREAYIKKTNICNCALEETMNEISYIRYKLQEESFISAFNKNVDSCLK